MPNGSQHRAVLRTRNLARTARRVRREVERACRERDQGRPARRGDHIGQHSAAAGGADPRPDRRRRAAGDDGGDTCGGAFGPRGRGDDHCRPRGPEKGLRGGVRPGTTMETLAGLRPAFEKEGTITAANASQISDGGSALVMMSERAVNARGVSPLGQVVSYGMVAGPDSASLLHQPSRAINAALERAGKVVDDIDLFEINEAFAAVGIASMNDLGITDQVVNVNGGAIALGHPIGMSGNRLALTLLHELRRRGGGLGAAGLCGGGGQGDALLVRSL